MLMLVGVAVIVQAAVVAVLLRWLMGAPQLLR
jgi:hypothetical protein